MKTALLSVKLLCSLVCLLPATSAIKDPRGLVRGATTNAKNRQLEEYTGIAGCQAKLSQCRGEMGGISPPYSQMAGFLDQFGDDVVGATDLKNALTNAAKGIDFTGLAAAVKADAGDDLVANLDFNTILSPTFLFGPLLSGVVAALNALVNLLSGFFAIPLKPVTDLITALGKIIAALPTANLTNVIITETFNFIANVVVFILQQVFSLRVSDEEGEALGQCTEEALACETNLYMMTVVPIVTGDMVLAKALSDPNV